MANDDERDPKPPPSIVIDTAQAAVAGAITGHASGLPHGAEAGAVLGVALAGGRALVSFVSSHVRTADERLDQAQAELAGRAFDAAAPKVAAKLEELSDAVGSDEAAATVLPIVEHWSPSWKRAEGKKRRVIMAALVSAFDPESYEAAMTHRFFKIIDELDYPELHWLCSSVRKLRVDPRSGQARSLVGVNLNVDDYRQGDTESGHRERLRDAGLLLVGQSLGSWTFKSLGLELVAFLERGGYSGAPDDEPAPPRTR